MIIRSIASKVFLKFEQIWFYFIAFIVSVKCYHITSERLNKFTNLLMLASTMFIQFWILWMQAPVQVSNIRNRLPSNFFFRWRNNDMTIFFSIKIVSNFKILDFCRRGKKQVEWNSSDSHGIDFDIWNSTKEHSVNNLWNAD